jgi:galactoside O-acetyltransferase
MAWLRFQTYRRHGVILPRGALILRPENIRIGKDFGLNPGCLLLCQDRDKGSELVIGDRVALNYNVQINADSGGRIYISDNVIIGPGCILRAADHSFERTDRAIRDQLTQPGVIRLDDDVWLGAGVIVLKDVTIGRSSVIGAGSVVTGDIPPYSIAVGIPARVIRTRSDTSYEPTEAAA